MDKHLSFRISYLAAAPHSFYIAFTWIAGGLLGEFYNPRISIIFFLISGALNFPAGELLRKLCFPKTPATPADNKLPMLFKLMSFTVPLSLPLIYFASRENINYFYPCFAIIVGAHYLPFYYGYRLPSFIVTGLLMWMAGTFGGLYFADSFTPVAFISGILIGAMGLINYRIVKAELDLSPPVDRKLHKVE